MKLWVEKEYPTIWQGLLAKQKALPSFCGGRGSCGKCRVRVIQGKASVSKEERRFFTEEELSDGWRLSCLSRPETDCLVELFIRSEEDLTVLGVREDAGYLAEGETFSIGVDLGTTTIAMALADRKGKVVKSYLGMNRQRSLGADVVSRIGLAVSGRKEELTGLIREDIETGVMELVSEYGSMDCLEGIIIAGNTTMEQLFLGYSVEKLGVYPFTPCSRDFMDKASGELYPGWNWNGKILCFPCAAGFVGGDIAAGLYALDLPGDKTALFLDLGTNGELALCHKGLVYLASTAAGPVFEGGNITWGMGSGKGAIMKTRRREDYLEYETIGGLEPEGICGSGLIEIIADLLDMKVITGDGSLSGSYQKNGYGIARKKDGRTIVVTQADIREFQMAKAAISAGIRILLQHAGITMEEVGEIYLAGGFGNGLEMKKAVRTGLLPRKALRCGKAVGNTALKGCLKYIGEGETGREQVKKFMDKSIHIHLAQQEKFQKLYLEEMEFKSNY